MHKIQEMIVIKNETQKKSKNYVLMMVEVRGYTRRMERNTTEMSR